MTEDFSNKLAKLLALASSDIDAEAIAALRAANRLLKANGLTWLDVFKMEQPKVVSLKDSFDEIFGEDEQLADADFTIKKRKAGA